MNNYFTGKTVDEAVENALNSLGLTKDQAEIIVIEEASRGIFGIGAHPAKVMVTKKEVEKAEEEPIKELKSEAKQTVETKKEKKTVEKIQKVDLDSPDLKRTIVFLEGLFDKLATPTTIETSLNEENKIIIDLKTSNSSALIGYRGEVLDSIQFLASAVYNNDKDEYQRIVVDCENYRAKREQTLNSLSNRLAQKAIRTGRKVRLEPMNPFERRIIHSAIAKISGVKTESEGKEPNRYVVIIPEDYDPSKDRKSFKGKNGDRRGRGDRGSRDRKPASSAEKPKKKFDAGVFLGNSLKDKE